MKKYMGKSASMLCFSASMLGAASSALAITQAEINQENAAAEAACKANRQFGSLTANSLLNELSAWNFDLFWNVIKDGLSYGVCQLTTPKSIAKLAANAAPKLVKKLDEINASGKSDAEKGKDLSAAIQPYMAPQYGYVPQGDIYIKAAPLFGVAQLSWNESKQTRTCKAGSVGVQCSGDSCYPVGDYVERTDNIIPSYEVYRIVNDVDYYIGTIAGGIITLKDTEISITGGSPSALLSSLGKSAVVSYSNRLKSVGAGPMGDLNIFYDYNAGLESGVPTAYKIRAIDPGSPRGCTSKRPYDTTEYIVGYDMDADGIPDFVDKQWYASQRAAALAPALVPILGSMLNE